MRNRISEQIDHAAATLRAISRDLDAVLPLAAPPQLSALLRELVAASDDAQGHFARYAHELGLTWEAQSDDCRADWSRCCRRKDAAVAAVLAYARALPDRRDSYECAGGASVLEVIS